MNTDTATTTTTPYPVKTLGLTALRYYVRAILEERATSSDVDEVLRRLAEIATEGDRPVLCGYLLSLADHDTQHQREQFPRIMSAADLSRDEPYTVEILLLAAEVIAGRFTTDIARIAGSMGIA